MRLVPTSHRALVAGVIAITGAAGGVGLLIGSDHQDTPDVELNPKMDLTDLYVFPSKSDPAGRIVLVMDTRAFLSPGDTDDPEQASFDRNLLYQFKVDNNGDNVEDRVIQVTFDGSGADQRVTLRGPVAPPVIGAMGNTVADATPAVRGDINTTLGEAGGVQLFAGARDDPFFVDLEATFCILPDRKPVTGPLSQPCALDPAPPPFRPAGQAVNYVAGFNVLSIIVELPKSQLEGSAPGRLGVWATISR